MSKKLPRGIWYEAKYNRYRVRLYRNKVPHLIGYFPTEEAAVKALEILKERLKKIPKRSRRDSKAPASPPKNAFADLAKRIHSERAEDPRTYRAIK